MNKYYIYMGVIILFDLVNALAARQAYETGSLLFIIIAVVSLMIAGFLFTKSLNYKETTIANIAWLGGGTLLITIFGFLIFNETLNLSQIIGMMLILSGLITMELMAPKEQVEEITNKE